jgi:hypothetical protein
MRREIQEYLTATTRVLSSSALALVICVTAIGLLAAREASGQIAAKSAAPTDRKAVVVMDRATLSQHFRALGYKARGKVGREKAESDDPGYRTFPHFSSSFSVNGVTYPFTMLGYPPKSGRSATFRSVVIPLRMNFVGFGPNGDIAVSFDATPAVINVVHSPMYQNAGFVNGYGQFGQMMQRAAFWNKMDKDREWSVRMGPPRILQPIDVEVTPETGVLFQDASGNYFGDVLFSLIDSLAQVIIQVDHLDPDELPVFVTQNVAAEALGYHSAYPITNRDHSVTLQTFIYTSWLDPALVDPIIADVSTFNHENLEWMNDPFAVNVVPVWMYPPVTDPRTVCSYNNLLEVGDPQGNGPTFDDFPTVVVPIDGVQYHLQQLALFQWFTDESPSSAENGWYSFPDPTSITTPATYCP